MSFETLTRLHPDIKVKHSEEFSFSKSPPVDFFDSDKKNITETAFSNLYNYLTLPYIIDSFEDHDKRRDFKKGLEPRILEAYGTNALRKGKVGAVDFSLQILSRLYIDKKDSEFSARIDHVRSYLRNSFGQDYDSLHSNSKIDRASNLKEKIVYLLNHLEVKKEI